MMGTPEIRVGTWGIRVGMREMRVGMLGMWGMRGIRVGIFFVYQVDEFSFKEMRTWVSPRFHLLVFVFGVNQEN